MSNMSNADNSNIVAVDQAVFTSVRSPTGEGYRIIAASPGVRVDEKSEITRRAPSHGSLCSDAENATGLLAYPLASGRFAIAFCCHAGKEHTNRGGQRVYTHFAVMSSEQYARFAFDAARVSCALREAVGEQLVLKQLPTLPQINLGVSRMRPVRPDAGMLDATALVASAVFGNKVTLAIQDSDPRTGLEVLLAWLPAATRRKLAVSAGIKFSPSRQLLVSFLLRDNGEGQRALRGQPVNAIDCAKASASPRAASPYDPWFDFVRCCVQRNRMNDLAWITAAIDEAAPADRLTRIATIFGDLESVAGADEQALNRFSSKWMAFDAKTSPESNLLADLRQCIADRMASLKAPEKVKCAVGSV
jgi:hypothetical protein